MRKVLVKQAEDPLPGDFVPIVIQDMSDIDLKSGLGNFLIFIKKIKKSDFFYLNQIFFI